jgi:hypothetical protein
MAVAIIGVIGLVLGALFTGLLENRAARRKQRAGTWAAASLIATELDLALRRLRGALKARAWWKASLPNKQWEANVDALALGVDRELLDQLAATYALLENWDFERVESASPEGASAELTSEQIVTLEDNVTRIEAARTRLRGDVRRSYAARLPAGFRFAIGIVGACLIAAPFVVAGSVQRSVETDASVAAALQRVIPDPTLVNCSEASDQWRCNVDSLSGGCQLRTAGSAVDAPYVKVATRPNTAKGGCDHTDASGAVVVAEGPRDLVAFARTRAAEMQMHADALPVKVAKESWFERAFKKVFGGE